MAQDIRELFKNDKGIPAQGLQSGHDKRFEAKLNTHFGKAKTNNANYMWLKIAAVCVVIFAIGSFFLSRNSGFGLQSIQQNTQVAETANAPLHLSDLSPEFKKLEDYYLASINVELAQLNLTDDNKELIDSYISQLEELNTEYKKLNADLVEVGVSDQTVSTLIDNLQLRLTLLFKLKDKLKDIKQVPNVENQSNRI